MIRLIFKNNLEQELWYIIINELWSGLTIAHDQCDTAVLNKASRHIVLMDALSNINYNTRKKTVDKRLTNSHMKSNQQHNEVSNDIQWAEKLFVDLLSLLVLSQIDKRVQLHAN